MGEDKMKSNLDKIEKLIVDGQKEVLGKINRLEEGQKKLEEGQKRIENKLNQIDKKHDNTATALYGLLQDTKKDLDAHIRQPAHA